MRGKRATTARIIAVLKEAEVGAKPMELCRKYGISNQTLYKWKAKYGARHRNYQLPEKTKFIASSTAVAP